MTCEAEHGDYRCWRRATSCDGDHFAVEPNVDRDVRTRPNVVTWRD